MFEGQAMTIVDLGSFNVYWGIILNALCTGIGMGAGLAIGTYLINKHFLGRQKEVLL